MVSVSVGRRNTEFACTPFLVGIDDHIMKYRLADVGSACRESFAVTRAPLEAAPRPHYLRYFHLVVPIARSISPETPQSAY